MMNLPYRLEVLKGDVDSAHKSLTQLERAMTDAVNGAENTLTTKHMSELSAIMERVRQLHERLDLTCLDGWCVAKKTSEKASA